MFEKIVEFTPAFDRRDPNPAKDYGIHGVDLRMVLKGPLGAVQFVVYTNWQLPHVQKEMDDKTLARGCDDIQLRCFYHPYPTDVGYHSPAPMYEGQEIVSTACPYVEGGQCYYDGSGLRAEEWFKDIFLPKGSDGIWEALEQEYHERFGGNK